MPREDLIQLRGGTAAQWTTANPILAAREPGVETDTGKVKYGNGTDHWADLPYASSGGGFESGYFTALNVVAPTDGADVPTTLIADARYGALPSWIGLTGGGQVALGVDAGGCVIQALDICTIDYSGTTPPGPGDVIQAIVTVRIDGYQITTGNAEQAGDNQDTQIIRPFALDLAGGDVLSIILAAAGTVPDGVASHDVYLKITRLETGPVPGP